jgi:hypothetical protein
MSYIYAGNFVAPEPPRVFSDGRDECTAALKKILSRGPRRPDSLQKRARPDSDVRAENAMLLSKSERRKSSNADEALSAIRDIHSDGPQRVAPVAEGDAAFESKSVNMVKRAHGHALPVSRNGLPSVDRDLAKRLGKVRVNVAALVRSDLRKGSLSSEQWRRMTWQERRDFFRKGSPPQSSNASWDNTHANTGAGNDWRDETEMGETVTARIGGQVIGVPSQTNFQAALDAIKRDLRKPKNLLGGPISVGTADHDEGGDELPRKRKHRADEEEE